MPLAEYRRKRDFRVTREPRGSRRAKSGKRLRFVVQKHDATRLHYDFRLELDGVLKSWAVPKGPSLDPRDKRLAVQVEDHPIEYGKFEGTIPEGEYGGGAVMLWDRGTWTPLVDPAKGLREGSLKFQLHGKKLNGEWMLVRRGGRRAARDEKNWFLFKTSDRFARTGIDVTAKQPDSVTTGRTIDKIEAAADWVWTKDGQQPVRRKKTKVVSASVHEVAGVTLTHPDKILYADHGITKADLAQYYEKVAKWMLPHVTNRLLSLVRCPAGASKPCFFQKHPDIGSGEHFQRVKVRGKTETTDYVAIDDLAGLVSLVQMGVLEIHVWGSQADDFEKPDRLVFDLDPDPAVEWKVMVAAATEARELLQALELVSFLKTTGGKGLHIVVPIRRTLSWVQAKSFCRAVANFLVRAAPDRYVATMSKAARKGKIFVDFLRNDRGATSIAPYSTRARPGATVSTPIRWDELNGRLRSDHFNIGNVPPRLAGLKQDPWAELPTTKQTITRRMLQYLQRL